MRRVYDALEIWYPTIFNLANQSIYFKKNYHYLSLLYIIIIGINEPNNCPMFFFFWKINIKYNKRCTQTKY